MSIEKQIGARIKKLRIEKKLTQEQLAWDAAVDRTYMNHVENSRKNISVRSLEKIVKALNTDMSTFFKEFKK
ncbi:MAG: helix-turn-helix transcriptional regulator [Bacteroidetes bacterium]|nr:helix-turn-helix transcriptional regulator [Bacteroidota bacterium]